MFALRIQIIRKIFSWQQFPKDPTKKDEDFAGLDGNTYEKIDLFFKRSDSCQILQILMKSCNVIFALDLIQLAGALALLIKNMLGKQCKYLYFSKCR